VCCVSKDLFCVSKDLSCVSKDLCCVSKDLCCVSKELCCSSKDLCCISKDFKHSTASSTRLTRATISSGLDYLSKGLGFRDVSAANNSRVDIFSFSFCLSYFLITFIFGAEEDELSALSFSAGNFSCTIILGVASVVIG